MKKINDNYGHDDPKTAAAFHQIIGHGTIKSALRMACGGGGGGGGLLGGINILLLQLFGYGGVMRYRI